MQYNINSSLFAVGNFQHHCATICPVSSDDYVIAAYCGRECTDQQRVFLKYHNTVLFLDFKTGNPVLWRDEKSGKIWLLYSKFEDIGADGRKPKNPVERWMFCSNWLMEIQLFPNNIVATTPRRIDEAFGHLGRCAPIICGGDILVPLYRELEPLCSVWVFKDGELTKRADFGQLTDSIKREYGIDESKYGSGLAMQPTLFFKNDVLFALCRNITNKTWAWESRSIDCGKTWEDMSKTYVPNHNYSLVALNDVDSDLIVTNLDRYRQNLYIVSRSFLNRQLGYDSSNINKIIQNSYGLGIPSKPLNGLTGISYPNYMVHNSKVHIVHTNKGLIAHHIMDIGWFKDKVLIL